jgi:hypothetical protein
MALDIPLPTASPNDDPLQYIPLLLSAIEGFLLARDVWEPADYDDARQYMEQLMSYIVSLMEQGIVTVLYPEVFVINPLSGTKIAGTTLSRVINTSQIFNLHVEVTAAAINNELSWPFFAKGGTYAIHVLGARGTNYGRVAPKIDGNIADSEQDWYNATAANNIEYVYNCQIGADGQHTLNLVSQSKNASSSSYRFLVSSIYGVRTGA